MNRLLLMMKLICLMAVVSLSSCANYDITQNHPTFLDTTRGYGRVYNTEKITPAKCGDPNYKFSYSNTNIPTDKMNEYVCFRPEEVQYNLKYYNAYIKKNANCTQGSEAPIIDESIFKNEALRSNQ